MKKMFVAALVVAAAAMATAAPATITASYEAAGVQNTSRALVQREIATFDDMAGWVGSGSIFSGPISGTITQGGFLVGGANLFGGAGGTGNFATVQAVTSIQLSSAVTYAGLWASSIDGDFSASLGNSVALYSGDTLVGSYALTELLSGASNAYYGNPNSNFQGMNASEPYAFFNFASTTAFDRIDLIENGGGGFELDNVTIGNVPALTLHRGGGSQQQISQGAVPEPASWALMLIGFGVTGSVLRGTRRRAAIA